MYNVSWPYSPDFPFHFPQTSHPHTFGSAPFYFKMQEYILCWLMKYELAMLAWSCAGNHSYNEFMCSTTMSCPEDNISQPSSTSFGFYILLMASFTIFTSPGRVGVGSPFVFTCNLECLCKVLHIHTSVKKGTHSDLDKSIHAAIGDFFLVMK